MDLNELSAAINTLGAFCGRRDVPALYPAIGTTGLPGAEIFESYLEAVYGPDTRAANPAFA